tara:strand:+ start:2149 stop:2526 length:378 start_codon:yes stop_codon:yes gene_type:complete
MGSVEENKKMKDICENLERMDDNAYGELDLHMTINGGLSIEELTKTIHFHKFTKASLLFLINQINNHRCTYKGIGPFIKSDGGWYNIRERKIEVIKKLTEENMRLKKEIENFKINTTTVLNFLAN